MTRTTDGFSLIEALVALLILAIATVGLIRTTEAHIDSARALEQRSAALWVAENRLAELTLGASASLPGEVEMLGTRWTVATVSTATDDPEIVRVDIRVSLPGQSAPVASLEGFVDGRPSA